MLIQKRYYTLEIKSGEVNKHSQIRNAIWTVPLLYLKNYGYPKQGAAGSYLITRSIWYKYLQYQDYEKITVFDKSHLKSDPVRIGLIADTHVPRDAKAMPPHVREAFKDVHLILHAGDIYVSEILDELEKIAPVVAARGNGDWDMPPDSRLGVSCVIKIAGLTIGLSHALHYWGILNGSSRNSIEKQFNEPLDIAVIGDTHYTSIERHDDLLIVNPGSPTMPKGMEGLGTVGILEITGGIPEASIIQLSDFNLPVNPKELY